MVANCDVCGWLAAIGGMLAFGTFGVPIKSEAARSVDIGKAGLRKLQKHTFLDNF